MALQSLNHPIAWPDVTSHFPGGPSLSTGAETIDAAGEYVANVQYAREDMTVTHFGIKMRVATGSPIVDLRIETVDATTGYPTGTLIGTNTNIVTTALDTNFNLFALTAAATIPVGTVFAAKCAYSSGTSASMGLLGNTSPTRGAPYWVTSLDSVTSKVSLTNNRCWALGSSSTTFYSVSGMLPAASVTAGTFNNTNSARRGLRFQVPYKCRMAGIRYYTGITNNGNFNLRVFADDGTTALDGGGVSFDGNQLGETGTAVSELWLGSTRPTLSPGTWYRAVVEPSSATNMNFYTVTLPSANYRSAWRGGTNYHYTSYASSVWTDSGTDTVPLIDILIDQLDDGVNTGGSGGYVIGG